MKNVSAILVTLCSLFFSTLAFAVPPFIEGQIVVKGEPKALSDFEVIKKLPKSGLTVYRVDTGKELGQLQKLRKKGLRAGLNFIANATLLPTDSYYSYQWHLPAIQSEQAWDMTRGAQSVVAVLDTGIVPGGADGVNVCSFGAYDVVNGDSNPVDGSDLSHGTHVAGTISQRTSFDLQNPGFGTVGVAPEACVMPIKVLNDSGSGSFADIAEGIYRAVDAGAQVINMSLGVSARYGITSDPLIDPALDYAEQHNVLVVAAAGNDGHRKNVSYPAIYATVVAVGATDLNNAVVRYSNRGTGLDIMAPGGDTSADANNDGYPDGVLQETYYQQSFGHYFLQGTSMASPHVAGVAALMVASGFNDVSSLRGALFSSSLDLESSGYDQNTGYGLVQAFNALVTGSGTNIGPPSAPTQPQPADNATGVPINTVLGWTAAANADSYKVYFGTNTLALVSETGATDFAPGNLQYDTLYQWQVIAVNADGETAGSIWYFTTEAAPVETGTYTDNDGDGYYAEVDDCNDNDAHVYPGHPDTKGRWGKDGVDNDCNGVIDG